MKDNFGVVALAVAVLVVGVLGLSKDPVIVNVASDGETRVVEKSTGAIPGTDVYQDMTFYESVKFKASVTELAATSIYSTTTLQAKDSGSLLSVSASGTTITLPAVTEAGTSFTVAIGGAVDSGNVIVDSAEGDNIEGSLIVAGAVVDCAAEDQVNFVTDGENVGDSVTLISDGTSWLIVDSNALTAAKLTCTDPS